MESKISKPKSANSPQQSVTELEAERTGHSTFPIVAMGASAGGLEAFRQLLPELPDRSGMAFVLIQHLDPNHPSRLKDVLAPASRMPIEEVSHSRTVEPDHVYVIAPDVTMTIEKGTLLLTPRGQLHTPHLSVDAFFRSLALDAGSRAIGVVLSGTGSDGTLGLMEIKAAGGVTFAQDESTAKHTGMPHSAIESGCVDFVHSPEEIARAILRLKQHPYLAESPQPAPPSLEEEFQRVLSIVRRATGVDFSKYRDTTIQRRVQRRMMFHSKRSLAEYGQLLVADRAEIDALYRDLLINVTSFFRDPEVFESLKSVVFPEIVQSKPGGAAVRIWVPGCSTGQEAYSLAIALLEFLDHKGVQPAIQIFATDLSDAATLERARAGIYPESIESEVSPERLRRFFRKDGHTYRIERTIRDMCVFARQNLASDPPFSRVDLISCRNVLIYMSQALQRRVMPIFHYALNQPGFLLLGSSESVGSFTEHFDLVDRTAKIYAKKPFENRVYPNLVSELLQGYHTGSPRSEGFALGPTDFQREADRILLRRFSPPAVLVDERLNIVQFRGQTSEFLESPTGEPTTSLLKMAREGLLLELQAALRDARSSHRVVRREGIRVAHAHHTVIASIEVVPVSLPGSTDARYLILFDDGPRSASGDGEHAAPGPLPLPPVEEPAPGVTSPAAAEASESELGRVRSELAATKEFLQSLLEQQDAVNEELRSANEEILSSNEELQSTNEELETAKEELQSTNEELTTVNEQLQLRNAELTRVNNDLTNLLASTMIPLVMVDADMLIRRFTPTANRVMNLLPTDMGRPVGDIKMTVNVPELDSLIARVIETVSPIEREVRDREGKWFSLRIHPYRTSDRRIDGAVIALVDIDHAKRAQEEIEEQAKRLRTQASLLDLSKDAIIVMDGARRIHSWNRGAEEMYGYSKEEAGGKITHEFLKTTGTNPKTVDADLARTGTWDGEIRHVRKDRQQITVQSRQVLVRGAEDIGEAILEINRDITGRLRDEARLREQSMALIQADRRKDEFLAMLAHELRNPLAPVRNAVRILRMAHENEDLLVQAQDVLERQVEQLSRIVDDLLDMTRIAEGKIELRKERVKFSAIVQTAVESSRSMIEARGHKLVMNFPVKPLYLEGDSARLAQVLTNLLNNAAKFTDTSGDIVLDIEREQGARDSHGFVRVSVKDNGIGMSPELLEHAFEMFYQGDQSLERTRGGLGVGLTLVQSLVRAHGGTIEARSDGEGKGSEFIVRLPLSAPPAPPAKEEAVSSAKAPRVSRRLLVVDDNRDQAESLGMLLEIMGHQVRIAYNGAEALEIAQSFQPQMILLDIGLPNLNGYEVARRIREFPALHSTVLVAQTGWGEEGDRQRSTEAGFDHHFVKPVDVKALERILDELKA